MGSRPVVSRFKKNDMKDVIDLKEFRNIERQCFEKHLDMQDLLKVLTSQGYVFEKDCYLVLVEYTSSNVKLVLVNEYIRLRF